MRSWVGVLAGLLIVAPVSAQNHVHSAHHRHDRDTTFAALQARGLEAMGVDQYTSTHAFDILEDGGRIALQRNTEDAEGTEIIRAHMRDIAEAFRTGDFSTPFFVHDGEVPGTAVMAAKKDVIEYTYQPLPRGGEVRITTTDPVARAAIAEFMRFQRGEHHAAGHGG